MNKGGYNWSKIPKGSEVITCDGGLTSPCKMWPRNSRKYWKDREGSRNTNCDY